MNRWHVIALFTLMLGGPWLWVNRVPVEAQTDFSIPQPALDHPAPDFTLPTLTGQEFTLSAYQGTPIVLNFWATWCGPCQNEMPALQRAATRFGERVQFVGVDQGETTAVVERFATEMGVTFTLPIDPEMAIGELYAVRAMPTTFFIDRTGVIRHIYLGEMNSVTIVEGIAEILR